MNPIFTALAGGYTADQIIKFIQSAIPKLSPKINSAKKQGYSADKIVEFLSDTMQTESDESYQTSNRIAAKKREENKQLTKDILKQGVKLGATGLSYAVLSKMAPKIGQSISNSTNQTLQNLINPRQSQSNNQPPVSAMPITQNPNPPNPAPQPSPQPGPNIGQQIGQQASSPVAQAIQPNQSVPVPPQPNPVPQSAISDNLRPIIDRITQSGNGPEQVEGYLLKFHPKEVRQFEKESGKSIRQSIEEYIKKPSEQNNNQDLNISAPEEIERNEVGSSVLLPDGQIGQIDSIKQGIAKVNIDGKDRHKKLDELIQSPLPEKDLADLYKDVLSGIEKQTGQQVSRNVYWAGYDPTTNELAFIPHHGSLYVYKDISPKDAQELTSYLTQRKTSGENYIGAWEAGTKSPIGAAMSALIQRLQKKAGKGKEYSGKYEKIYDALEVAKLAANRKKHEKRKA